MQDLIEIKFNVVTDALKQAISEFQQAVAFPGLLSDKDITERCVDTSAYKAMITPFHSYQVKEALPDATGYKRKLISFGLGSYGYDIRIGEKFKVFTNIYGKVIDPKAMNPECFIERDCGHYLELPPHSFALGESVETFNIPRDILATCIGKSTYARCGIIVNVTPLEPEWRGKLTLEISNTTACPARIYTNEGIAQLLFFKARSMCAISYADRKGKYQDQEGVTVAKV